MESEDIIDALDTITSALKPYAEKTFESFVQGQTLSGFEAISFGVLLMLLYFVSAIFFRESIREDEETKAIMFLLGIVVIILTILAISTGLQKLINPEYYAIKEIVSVAKCYG